MKRIGDHIKEMQTSRFELLDEYCEVEHTKPGYPEYKMAKQQLMIIDGKKVCPRCELEKQNQALSKEISDNYERSKRQIFFNKSLVVDETLLAARLDNYNVSEPEETKNLQLAKEYTQKYEEGVTFNVIMYGNPGAGKSHLAYSMLYQLNDRQEDFKSCLFLNLADMFSKIKDSFKNHESIYTQEYFMNLVQEVDFLVMDDLGAETGAIESDKQATQFVHQVLYSALTKRQGKSTIFTTNLPTDVLKKLYDTKIFSRLFRRPKYLLFTETSDKRVTDLPF